jgi:energy-coupling factor transporter transmembrane protein EcfT
MKKPNKTYTILALILAAVSLFLTKWPVLGVLIALSAILISAYQKKHSPALCKAAVTIAVLSIMFNGFFVVKMVSVEQLNLSSLSKRLPTEREYTNKTLDDFYSVFNPNSAYTNLQKQSIFDEEYKDRYVKWTGKVQNVDMSVLDNLRLYVSHEDKSIVATLLGGDVVVYMNQNQYDKLLKLKKGQQVTFSARVRAYSKFITYEFFLDDGEIVS